MFYSWLKVTYYNFYDERKIRVHEMTYIKGFFISDNDEYNYTIESHDSGDSHADARNIIFHEEN